MTRFARIASWLAFGTAAIPPLAIALLVARHARNVPWKDQWGFVPLMVEASHGELDARMLWRQVNEHRIPITLLVQWVLAWATHWDLRYEAWGNVIAAGLTFVALAGLVRRTIRPSAPGAAAWIVLVASLLTFSLTGGTNWQWGSLNATYIAALAAAVLAWSVAVWKGRWRHTAGLVACATVGALAFGAGVALLVLLPLALLVIPSIEFERRVQHAVGAVMWASGVIVLYFVGWVPRAGVQRPVMHWDRLIDYGQYVVVYVGGGLGTANTAIGLFTGVVLSAGLGASSVWLWTRCPGLRSALVPWWLLAAYSVANGAVTAFGRLDNGLFTALFVRYRPTVSFFLLSTVALAVLATTMLRRRAPSAGVAALATLGLLAVAAAPSFYASSVVGLQNMNRLAQQLDAGARCLPTCATAPDRCLLKMCWSADLARRVCPLMAAARIGPFAR